VLHLRIGTEDGFAVRPVPRLSRFIRAFFQFSKRAASEAAKFGRGGVELLGVVGAARLECDEPAAETCELIRRQLGDCLGDLFDFHATQYSTAGAWLSQGRGIGFGGDMEFRSPYQAP